MIKPEEFKQDLLKAGILDPIGLHHEFAGGQHGRKLDFGKINRRSNLYRKWVEITARMLYEIQGGRDIGKVALIGVANGTNRFASDVAHLFRETPLSVETVKTSPKTAALTDEAKQQVEDYKPSAVYIIDDVGTEGNATASAGVSAREVTPVPIAAVYTWKRRPQLEKLDAVRIPYYAVIDEPLPTYLRDECIDFGYCYEDWDLITHD